MVRKIPVRKHRGVKDPAVQQARRNADSSINAAPLNPKEQELPKSVLEIQRLCQLVDRKDEPRKKKKKNNSDLIDSLQLYDKDPVLRGMKRKGKNMPRIIQRKGECDESFIHRFSAAARDYIKEVELENKHDVDFDFDNNTERDGGSQQNTSKSGSSSNLSKKSNSRKRKQEFDPYNLDTTKFNKRRRKGNLNAAEKVAKPNKQQRRKRRQELLNKEEHYENELYDSEEDKDFAILKDEVAFGEVVHRPPQFTAKPRGFELNSKPGTKDLLLKQMMNTSSEKGIKKISSGKQLSNAQKHFLEKERLRVIQAYRDMKASKVKNK